LKSFQTLGLSQQITDALPLLGIHIPTDIQEKSIPLLCEGNIDFIGLAQTGTGKTAAFGLPLLEKVDFSTSDLQSVIIAPTRELGLQIHNHLRAFAKLIPNARITAIYGGASIGNQLMELHKRPQIIVATPGRLTDFVRRKKIDLSNIRFVILDEADEMLQMGFIEDINFILSKIPSEKNTWLFSATMPQAIRQLVDEYMTDPQEIQINKQDKTNQLINHQYVLVARKDKVNALMRFLDLNPEMRCLVFCRTKAGTQSLSDTLRKHRYEVDCLHGDLSQKQRESVMNAFKSKVLRVVIATDVAARGIDVDDLQYVFHFDPADDEAYYTHRSGRTARAGKTGISLSFIDPREESRLLRLNRKLELKITKVDIPTSQVIRDQSIERWAKGIWESEVKLTPDLMDIALGWFHGLSREELIYKIMTQELKRLKELDNGKDLNVQRSENRKNGSVYPNQIFINIGRGNNVNKKDLIQFLSTTVNGLKGSMLGKIELGKRHCTIEIPPEKIEDCIEALNGKKFMKKRLLVKLDDNKRISSSKKHKSSKRKHKPKSKKHHH